MKRIVTYQLFYGDLTIMGSDALLKDAAGFASKLEGRLITITMTKDDSVIVWYWAYA
jgi:hypothetical protein